MGSFARSVSRAITRPETRENESKARRAIERMSRNYAALGRSVATIGHLLRAVRRGEHGTDPTVALTAMLEGTERALGAKWAGAGLIDPAGDEVALHPDKPVEAVADGDEVH